MKKLLILLLSISLLVACKNEKTKSASDTEKTSKDDYRNGDTDDEKDKKDDDGGIDRNSGNFDDVVDDDEEGNHVAEGANWSSADINSFSTECVNAAVKKGLEKSKAQTYCNCMLRKLTTKYPDVADAAKIDMESPSMKTMVNDCLGVKEQSSSSSGWSRKDELDFVNSCVREAKKGGMEDLDAQSYCDCMQYKIEKLYPNINDASRLTERDLQSPSMKKMIEDCKMEH